MIDWIEIFSTDVAALEKLAAAQNVNPLALEDCLHRDQRPKLDDYDSHQLLVWFMFADDTVYELQFLIFPDKVIAVPHEAPPGGGSWREYLRISNQEKDVWHLVYHALDKATDVTWHEIKKLFDKIDEYEQEITEKELRPAEILLVKKRLNEIDFSIGHLSSVAKQLTNLCKPTDDLNWKLRDLHDHCERFSRSIGLYRSQVANIIELYWGMQANRTNLQIKKLSLLASVAVPLTFWTSFWGMNFNFIPYSSPLLFFIALGFMVLSVLGTMWLLVRKGYWS